MPRMCFANILTASHLLFSRSCEILFKLSVSQSPHLKNRENSSDPSTESSQELNDGV